MRERMRARRRVLAAAIALACAGCGGREHVGAARAPAPRAQTEAPPAPVDDGSLPVVWRVDRAGPIVLGWSDGALTADDGGDIVVIDAASGAVRAQVTAPARESGFDDLPRAMLLGDALVTEPEPRTLAVRSLEGAERWRTPCAGPAFAACRVRAVRAGDALMIATGRSFLELVAFDASTGARRWSYAPDLGVAHERESFATDGALVFVATYAHRLVALDVTTGALRWEAGCDEAFAAGAVTGRGPAPCTQVSVAGDRVIAVGVAGSELLVFDAASGARRHRLLARDVGTYGMGAVASAGEALFVGAGVSAEAGAVLRLDLASGAVAWTHSTAEPVRSVIVRGDDVWARGVFGSLWRLHARDGEVLARWGLSGGHQVIDVGGGIVVDDASAVLRLDPARATGPDPEPVVSGTARLESEAGPRVAGLRVRVGDEVAITDESGAFSARVRARGGVHAWIEGDPPSPCDRYERVFVPLGAGEPLTLHRFARECLER